MCEQINSIMVNYNKNCQICNGITGKKEISTIQKTKI